MFSFSLQQLGNAHMSLTPVPSPLLTTSQVAEILHLAKVTVATYRMKGKGPVFIRMGKAIRYRLSDLQAWMDANAVGKVA
jgi:predicted DNA-binding transcriptional regulator AlpA